MFLCVEHLLETTFIMPQFAQAQLSGLQVHFAAAADSLPDISSLAHAVAAGGTLG